MRVRLVSSDDERTARFFQKSLDGRVPKTHGPTPSQRFAETRVVEIGFLLFNRGIAPQTLGRHLLEVRIDTVIRGVDRDDVRDHVQQL